MTVGRVLSLGVGVILVVQEVKGAGERVSGSGV